MNDIPPARRPFQGVMNIVRFNWPLYLVAILVAGAALGLAAFLPGPWWVRGALALGAGGALFFYDPAVQTEPSIARARRAYPHPPVPARPARFDALPLPEADADVALLILAAHEVRTPAGRDALFAEVARVLHPGGQAVLVEHGRDLANALAFGPGVLRFFPPAEWRRVARAAGFSVHRETRITPFVRVFDLRRP